MTRSFPSPTPPRAAVVVTRDEAPGTGRLGEALRALDVPVLHWPTTAVLPPEDPSDLQALPVTLASYDWVVFTSRNGVGAVAGVVGATPPGSVSVATVGEKTAQAAEEVGWTVALVGGGTGEETARALAERLGTQTARILLPTTPRAADTVADLLGAAGHQVDRIEAYRTGLAGPDPEACRAAVREGRVGVVTFTSPSAVDGLERALPPALFRRLVRTSRAVAIGPTTADAVRAAGWDPVEAAETSLEGVARRAAELLGRGLRDGSG